MAIAPLKLLLLSNMGISSPIGLTIGLLVILDRNDGQTKLEENISKNVNKMANNCPKITRKWTRVAIIDQYLDRHNFAILHPIWTNDPTKMIYSSRRIEWLKDLSSISFRSDFAIFGSFFGPWSRKTHGILLLWGFRPPNHARSSS